MKRGAGIKDSAATANANLEVPLIGCMDVRLRKGNWMLRRGRISRNGRHVQLCAGLTLMILGGCAKTGVVTTEKLAIPITLKAIVSYLPYGVINEEHYILPFGVSKQVDYRIYAASKWSCDYQTVDNDYVCCTDQYYTPYRQWNYCLLVDRDDNAFAYFDPDDNTYRYWPEGKKHIFIRTSPRPD